MGDNIQSIYLKLQKQINNITTTILSTIRHAISVTSPLSYDNTTGVFSLPNLSGTNTGDETLATIKSKLGITTLSGSNTGDQDLSAYATILYVDGQIAGLVDSSPATLDTLNELAAALGDDPNFATTITTLIGTKEDSFSKNTAFNKNYNTSTTNVKMNGSVAVGTQDLVARADHVHASDTTKRDTTNNAFNADVTVQKSSSYNSSANISITLGSSTAASVDNNKTHAFKFNVEGAASNQELVVYAIRRATTDLEVLRIGQNKFQFLGYNFALLTTVPASATAAGVTGQFSYDASYLYICTATNTWKRVAIAAW